MRANFRVVGGRDFSKMLATLPDRASRSLQRQAIREAAEPIKDTMVRLAPHEPGAPDLRNSITVSNVRGGDDIFQDEVAIAIGPSRAGFYGFFQEFGTVHHGAQPFARPAFDQNIQRALDIMRAFMWKAIAKKRGQVTGIGTSDRGLL